MNMYHNLLTDLDLDLYQDLDLDLGADLELDNSYIGMIAKV